MPSRPVTPENWEKLIGKPWRNIMGTLEWLGPALLHERAVPLAGTIFHLLLLWGLCINKTLSPDVIRHLEMRPAGWGSSWAQLLEWLMVEDALNSTCVTYWRTGNSFSMDGECVRGAEYVIPASAWIGTWKHVMSPRWCRWKQYPFDSVDITWKQAPGVSFLRETPNGEQHWDPG